MAVAAAGAGQPPPAALADDTGFLLRRAFERNAACAVPLLPPGRHLRDVGLLALLSATALSAPGGQLPQRRLGELLGLHPAQLTAAADGLAADGLLDRDRDPADRRLHALRLTGTGAAAVAVLAGRARACEVALTAGLAAGERRRLAELLRRLLPDLAALVPAEFAGLCAFWIPRAHLRLAADLGRPLARLGIAPRHFCLLAALAAGPPRAGPRLAAALGVSGPAMLATAEELAARELISRRRNPGDRREQLLELTAPGRELLADATRTRDGVVDQLALVLGAAGLAELNGLLTRIIS